MGHSATTLEKRRGYQQGYRQRNAEAISITSKDRYAHLVSLGICPVCRTSDAENDRVRCRPCADTANNRKKNRRKGD